MNYLYTSFLDKFFYISINTGLNKTQNVLMLLWNSKWNKQQKNKLKIKIYFLTFIGFFESTAGVG